jgi:hypothetical protein
VQNVSRLLRATAFVLLVIFAVGVFTPTRSAAAASQGSGSLRIYGSVNTPLNLTYSELLSYPMVSEVARLQCVAGSPDVTYNWTGIPLFYLLTLARVKDEAYKVVTRGSGGFESDLTLEDALRPTTILALGANGAGMPTISGIQGFYRLVVPDKWGYKWVGDVQEIEVVTTDYKGTWESSGYSDQADVPDSGPLPTQIPPLQTLDFSFGNRTFEVGAFTNASIMATDFEQLQRALSVNMTISRGATGFVDFIVQQDFLMGPYNVTLDEEPVSPIEADTNGTSYMFLPLKEGFHAARIVGAEYFGEIPEIIVNMTYTGQTVTFNASQSSSHGTITSCEWNFGDGANGTGLVVTHAYERQGTYQVKLNVTNNEGKSNSETLMVTVGSPPEYLPVKLFVATTLGLLMLMLVLLLARRKIKPKHHGKSAEV